MTTLAFFRCDFKGNAILNVGQTVHIPVKLKECVKVDLLFTHCGSKIKYLNTIITAVQWCNLTLR